jgi:hypothetical protein
MRHKLVASAAYLRSSGLSSSFLFFLLTANPAASGMSVLVTLLNDEIGENAAIPTKMKANIKSSRIMDQTRETIMSCGEIPSCIMTSEMKWSLILVTARTKSWYYSSPFLSTSASENILSLLA